MSEVAPEAEEDREGATLDSLLERGITGVAEVGRAFLDTPDAQADIQGAPPIEVDPLDFLGPAGAVVSKAVKRMRKAKDIEPIVRSAFAASNVLKKSLQKVLAEKGLGKAVFNKRVKRIEKATKEFEDDIRKATREGLDRAKPEDKRMFLLGVRRKLEKHIKKMNKEEAISRLPPAVAEHDLAMATGIISTRQLLKETDELLKRFPEKEMKVLRKAIRDSKKAEEEARRIRKNEFIDRMSKLKLDASLNSLKIAKEKIQRATLARELEKAPKTDIVKEVMAKYRFNKAILDLQFVVKDIKKRKK